MLIGDVEGDESRSVNDDVYFLESQTTFPVEADDIPVAVNCSSVRDIYKIK